MTSHVDYSEKIEQEKPQVYLNGKPLKEFRDYTLQTKMNGNVLFVISRIHSKTEFPLVFELLPTFKTKGQIYKEKRKEWEKSTNL